MKNEPAVCPTRACYYFVRIPASKVLRSYLGTVQHIDYFRGQARQDHACANDES